MLGRVSAAAALDTLENNEDETLVEAQKVIVWTAGYNRNDEQIETVHLLTDVQAVTIHENATSALLQELVEYYDDQNHASEVKRHSPLDRLLRMLRRKSAAED